MNLKKLFLSLVGAFNATPQTTNTPKPATKAAAQSTPKVMPRPAALKHQYPAVDEGLDATLTVDELLQPHAALVEKIKLASGANSNFNDFYLPAIRDLVAWVHALPGAEQGNHVGAGGMISLSLSLGFHVLQVADQNLFSKTESVERRQYVEQRWLLAAFLSGLYSELHIIPSRIEVLTENGTHWPCHAMPLTEFLAQHNSGRYFVRFRPNTGSNRDNSGVMAQRLLAAKTMTWLHEAHHAIIPTMLSAISGKPHNEDSKMLDILSSMRVKIVAIDAAAQPANYGKLKLGTHIDPYFIDAMRSLALNGTWKLNEPKARLWYGKDGLFIFWKTGFQEIRKHLIDNKIPGIPEQPDTVAEMLMQSKVFEPNSDGRAYWQISTPGSDGVYDGVKVANPMSILGELTDEIKAAILKTNIVAGQKATATAKSKPSAQPQLFDENPLAPASPPAQTPEDGAEPATQFPRTGGATNSSPETGFGEPRTESPQPTPTGQPASPPESNMTSSTAGDSSLPQAPQSQGTPYPEISQEEREAHALAKVQPVEEKLDATSENLLAQISDVAVRMGLRSILIDLRSGQLKDSFRNELGCGIPRRVLSAYGIIEDSFLLSLENVGWRERNPQKPGAKYHKVTILGEEVMAYIFKPIIAKSLGFTVHHDLTK